MRLAIHHNSAGAMFAIALLALTTMATAAGAVSLRSPQVVFSSASLQSTLNTYDGGINANTNQLDAQNFSTNVSGTAEFTLMVELTVNPAGNSIGVYNAAAFPPTLFQVFPGSATAGYTATCHFLADGTLKVDLADNNGTYLGTTAYAGVTRTQFAFYLQNSSHTFYSQDYRNALAAPQVLTFAGTGVNAGGYFECFEDMTYMAAVSDFDDAVLFLQSVAPKPVPTLGTSWGQLKAMYR